ncbi:MAG: DUF393 domain-containing protein [Chloroflexi bacterium]|nr:DUF393 domain-containing protein [Chloroflexota bacterium]
MRAHDAARRVRVLPSQHRELREAIGLSKAEADRAVWAIEPGGARYAGAAAVARILRELPGYAWLARLVDLPLAAQLAEVAYRLVACNRHILARLYSTTPECERPGCDCHPEGE